MRRSVHAFEEEQIKVIARKLLALFRKGRKNSGIPHVCSLTAFDVYRDGGSFSASFLDAEDIPSTLMFPVCLAQSDQQHRRYLPPVLERSIPVERISHVTGLVNKSWATEATPLTWQQAACLLKEMEPMVRTFVTDYPDVYHDMVAIAANDGTFTHASQAIDQVNHRTIAG